MPTFNATTIPNLNRALKALSREELQQFADRVFALLYLEEDGGSLLVNPDKEWDQDTIEEVDSALLEILDPRGGNPAPKPKPTLEERGYALGYQTLGHMLDACVGTERLTKGLANAAMRAWESEKRYSSDEVWDAVVRPALDRLADYVQNMKIRTR